MMLGTQVIVVDPEEEYKRLCEGIGGNYLQVDLEAGNWINPFDLSTGQEEDGEAILKGTIIRIKGLIGLMMEGLSVEEDAILEKAIFETYALKDINADIKTHKNEPPLLEDLQRVLMGMKDGENLARRLEKYTQGTFSGLFKHQTNIDMENQMNVFSVRDLDEELRPLAIYNILGYVWNQIRKEKKRRMMVVDEAWWMMQHEDSAKFLYALAKRARKYYLGLTVVSQDVEDVLNNKYGKAIVSNSSLQVLLKQSPSSIDLVSKTFNLTQGERYLLLQSDVGEGLFFAGLNHAAIKIIGSYIEDKMITTDPKEILEMKQNEEDNN
jgi:type IV secretory pathway VirB4 component